VRPPKTLREALDQIQEMLTDKTYSAQLWDVLVALRGPDSRNRKWKYATTAIIRSAAFPKRPCEERSIYGYDNKVLTKRRQDLFRNRKDQNHFRDHIVDAFVALDLDLYKQNGGVWKS
jgi:hypothetical protein